MWLEGRRGMGCVGEIATKYSGHPYGRDQERIVALIEVDHQRVGLG